MKILTTLIVAFCLALSGMQAMSAEGKGKAGKCMEACEMEFNECKEKGEDPKVCEANLEKCADRCK